MSVAALVPAAGAGLRLGAGRPKALALLAGQPLLVHAVHRLLGAPSVQTVVVAAPPAYLAEVSRLLAGQARVVAGGATRQESVAAALAAVAHDCEVVLVHDAARPLTPSSLVEAVARAVLDGAPAVVPGLVPVDTVKRVDAAGLVVETPPRQLLRAIQTPQGFRREVLAAAHAQAPPDALTDDAGLVELLGVPVRVVPGDPLALKVTTALDLALATALAAG